MADGKVVHLVLFTLRTDLAPTERQALLDSFQAAVGSIATVRHARLGERIVLGAGYEARMPPLQFVALLEFEDVAGLQAYLTHPVHEALGTRFTQAVETTLIYDFSMESPGSADAR